MERSLPCDKHEEQIKTLFEKDKSTNKRIDGMEVKVDDMTDMKIAITKISTSMDYLIEHNKKQDELNEKQNQTLDKINQNLNELNEGQRILNSKVEKLEKRVDENENKHSIDLRDIEKKKYTEVFFKYILPTGGGLIILLEIIKALKG